MGRPGAFQYEPTEKEIAAIEARKEIVRRLKEEQRGGCGISRRMKGYRPKRTAGNTQADTIPAGVIDEAFHAAGL